MGFLQAPSLAQAATAAILRSGYLSQRRAGEGNSFAVDLSSDRVRRAEWLLDGVRHGQSLGALLEISSGSSQMSCPAVTPSVLLPPPMSVRMDEAVSFLPSFASGAGLASRATLAR
jgi:hypothetical protein